jgi:hypothetical protein
MGLEAARDLSSRVLELGQKLLFNPAYTGHMAVLCFALEIPINLVIINYRACM